MPMLLLILQVLALVMSSEAAKNDLEIGCFVPGACVDAKTESIIREVPSAVECLQECDSKSDCQYFAHYSLNDDCILQKDCPKFNSTVCDQCVAGQKECIDIRCQLIGNCMNSVMLHFEPLPDVEECKSLCLSLSFCTWWSFNEGSGLCYIFENCVDINQNCELCTTSHRLCDATPEKAVPAPSHSSRLSARLLEKLHEGAPPGDIKEQLQRQANIS